MSKSPFRIAGMSTGINLDRLGDFSFSKESSAQKSARLGASMLVARNRGSQGLSSLRGAFSGNPYNPQQQQSINPEVSQEATSANVGQVMAGAMEVDKNQTANSIPDAPSSLVNPFGIQAQSAIGGTFGSLFDRQNSMGSALQKRACKYKNKK